LALFIRFSPQLLEEPSPNHELFELDGNHEELRELICGNQDEPLELIEGNHWDEE